MTIRLPLVVSLLLSGGTVLLSGNAAAERSVEQELSIRGRFNMTIVEAADERDNPSCHVYFTRPQGPRTPLFVTPDCIGDTPGMNVLGAVDRIGDVRFPITQGAVEFHMFRIASARGGNALEGSDYWVVTITNDGIWSHFVTSGEPRIGRVLETPSPSLIIEEPATTMSAGARFTIRFGSLSKAVLPKLARWVVDRSTELRVGDLFGGYGYTRYRPVLIEPSRRETVIDEDGPCKLPDTGDDWGNVRLRASFTTWNDGSTTVRCLQVTKLKARQGQ